MTLFIYDSKHENVGDGLDLGELSPETEKLLDRVIDWLDKKQVTNRYNSLVLAHTYNVSYPDGEKQIEFS